MAKSTKPTNVQVNLELSIPIKDYEVFEAVDPDNVQAYLNTCVANYLSAYADGGLMLSGDDIQAMSEALGEDVTSSSDIVNAVINSVSEEDSDSVFKVVIDPSLKPNIEDSARVQGVTVDHWLTNCWSHIITNGWLYGVSGDIRWVPFTNQQLKLISEAAGKKLESSSDIVAAVTAHSGVAV
jgi:hypothetical protein